MATIYRFKIYTLWKSWRKYPFKVIIPGLIRNTNILFKVWTDPSTNITNLYCQHGQAECELNALHACIVEHNTIEEQLEMFNCLLKGYGTDVDAVSSRHFE